MICHICLQKYNGNPNKMCNKCSRLTLPQRLAKLKEASNNKWKMLKLNSGMKQNV